MPKEKDINIVYHYCSVEAFLNIIQNSTLWLSDILKSNDSKEGIWIKDKINDIVVDYLSVTDSNALKAWEKWYQEGSLISTTAYVSCFSEQKDCLSQWRGYAQDGQGIAIGFSKKYLQQLNKPFSLLFDRVVYDNQRQSKFVNAIFKENIKKMRNGVVHAALELSSNYALRFSLYKNPSFAEEKEWRIILLSDPSNQNKAITCGHFCFHAPKYRVNNGNIISYLEMDFSSIKNDFIKEIWIGPKSKIESKQDIIKLLETYNYYNDTPYNELEPIRIEYSQSSYR